MTFRCVARLSIAPVVAGLLAGCAGAPKDAGFSHVTADSKSRTGYDVAWTRSAAEDAAALGATRQLFDRGELTLDNAVRVALLNNRQLQATFENLGIARGQLIQAGLLDNPVFGFDAWIYDNALTFEGLLSEDLTSIIYQPLRVGMRRGEFEATKRLVTAQVVNLVGDLRRAYFNYQADKQIVEMLDRTVQATRASYLVAAHMREAGGARQLDVLRERSLYEQAKVDLNAAVEHLATSREALNVLMGLWGDQLAWETPARLPDLPAGEVPVSAAPTTQQTGDMDSVEAVTPGEYPKMFPPMQRKVMPEGMPKEKERQMMMAKASPPPATPTERAEGLAGPPTRQTPATRPVDVLGQDRVLAAVDNPTTRPSVQRFADVERAAVQRNLALASARFVIDAQAYRLKLHVARAIVPFADVGLDSQKEMGETNWGIGPGGSVKVPLFDWGQGAYPREESRLRQDVENYAFVATTIRAAARTAEAQLQATRARAGYYRDVILPLHAALTAESQLQYNGMQIGQFDLLAAKRQQIVAGQQYIQALRDYWIARSNLEQVVDGSVPPTILPGGASPSAGASGAMQPGGGMMNMNGNMGGMGGNGGMSGGMSQGRGGN